MAEKEKFVVDPDDKRGEETAALLAERFKDETKRPVGRPKKLISDEREKDMWHDAAITAIRVMNINHQSQLSKAFDFADEYMRIAREKIEEISMKRRDYDDKE
jgi:hypothetical protein